MAGVGAELKAGFGGESCKVDNQPAKHKHLIAFNSKATLFTSKMDVTQS